MTNLQADFLSFLSTQVTAQCSGSPPGSWLTSSAAINIYAAYSEVIDIAEWIPPAAPAPSHHIRTKLSEYCLRDPGDVGSSCLTLPHVEQEPDQPEALTLNISSMLSRRCCYLGGQAQLIWLEELYVSRNNRPDWVHSPEGVRLHGPGLFNRWYLSDGGGGFGHVIFINQLFFFFF